MFKVLLIDDEPWILKDLDLLIDWKEYGFEVIAHSHDSNQALHLIKEKCPDLIICDIKMPGLNGIDLMKIVKRSFEEIYVVFLSAYGEFKYARQAIELGAFDYILKPAEEKELKDLLSRVREQLEEKEAQKKRIKKYQLLELFMELIENRFDSKTIKGKLQKAGYQIPYKNFILGIVEQAGKITKDNAGALWQDVLRRAFTGYELLFIQLGERKWTLLFNHQNLNSKESERFLTSLRKISNDNGLLIGLSDSFDDLGRLRNYYKQAEMMVYSYYIYRKPGIYLYSCYNNNYRELLLKIRGINSAEGFKTLLNKLPELISSYRINIEELAYLYNQLWERAALFFNLDRKPDLFDPVDIVYSFNNLEELFAQLSDFIISSENNFKPVVSNDLVEKVLKEIEENYSRDLCLQDLADKYHINYNYLSQLFKKETGQTFTNYLVELRIRKAIELFSEDLLFYEIAGKVGYNDYYHFCKIFKKHRGMNPSEFKKSHLGL